MARQASTFANHQDFGTFGVFEGETTGLEAEQRKVIASDIVKGTDGKANPDESRSGEVTVTVFKLSENADNPLEAALNLYGGSDVELAKAAIQAYNDALTAKAKTHVTDSIIGPEKTLLKTVKRIAKALGVDDVDALLAKVKANPAYLQMLTDLAK